MRVAGLPTPDDVDKAYLSPLGHFERSRVDALKNEVEKKHQKSNVLFSMKRQLLTSHA